MLKPTLSFPPSFDQKTMFTILCFLWLPLFTFTKGHLCSFEPELVYCCQIDYYSAQCQNTQSISYHPPSNTEKTANSTANEHLKGRVALAGLNQRGKNTLMLILVAAVLVSGLFWWQKRPSVQKRKKDLLEEVVLAAHFAKPEALFRASACKTKNFSARPHDRPSSATDAAFVQQICAIIETHLDNPRFGVAELASRMAMSRSQLHRKLVSQTSLSPNRLIRYLRLIRACILLQQADSTVTGVAYDVGFNDPNYFCRAFSRALGRSPSSFKQQAIQLNIKSPPDSQAGIL